MSTTNLFSNFSLAKFCLVRNYQTPTPMLWNEIREIMQSMPVRDICNQIEVAVYNHDDKLKTKLKSQLPAITVHACDFDDGKRTIEYAHWNGLVCLEYDHLTNEEIQAFRQVEPPTPNIILCGKSCSGTGVWMLIEVPQADYTQFKATLETVHEAYCQKILQKTGLDISEKVDRGLDLARLRYLPKYDYIFWDRVKDFEDKQQRMQPYYNMYEPVIKLCEQLPQEAAVGTRNTTYKESMIKVAQLTNNKHIMLKHLPTLGLDEKERQALVNWGGEKITPKPQKEKTQSTINTQMQPIDSEALPLPLKHTPKLIQTLVHNLPKEWKAPATIALLPVLSTACGQLSKNDGSPLVFQVAIYGEPQSGKTKFSARPATTIMDYISRNDNNYRKAIEKADSQANCPKVLAFTDTSTVQMTKYLEYAKNQTVMAYEGDLSSSLSTSESSFLDLKKLLRKGFDGETLQMDYKNEQSARIAIKARISALVVGTPNTIYNYFNRKSTSEGNSRRVIMVEHPMIMKNIQFKNYTEEELQFIFSELDYLESLPQQTLYEPKIEKEAFAWRDKKQKQANGDTVLWAATQTPTEMFQRAAYLMFALNHFDDKTINQCCIFGKWIAEYQYRSYINNTYNDQKAEHKSFEAKKAPSTQKTQEAFNQQMFESLPQIFTKQDVINYRIDNNYPHDLYNQAVVTRWRKQGLIAATNDKAWMKI